MKFDEKEWAFVVCRKVKAEKKSWVFEEDKPSISREMTNLELSIPRR